MIYTSVASQAPVPWAGVDVLPQKGLPSIARSASEGSLTFEKRLVADGGGLEWTRSESGLLKADPIRPNPTRQRLVKVNGPLKIIGKWDFRLRQKLRHDESALGGGCGAEYMGLRKTWDERQRRRVGLRPIQPNPTKSNHRNNTASGWRPPRGKICRGCPGPACQSNRIKPNQTETRQTGP